MHIDIVVQQQMKNMVLNLIKITKILILMEAIVQILHHKYYMKVVDLRKMIHGTIIMDRELRHG
jgi:hypothetical protein